VATNAALATLDLLWSVLAPLNRPLAVMGGISLASWGRVRATRDVDLLIAASDADLDGLIELLRANGFRTRREPPLISVGDHRFIQFFYTPPDEFYDVQFDLLLAETALQRSAIERRVHGDIPGINQPISVLSCEDLILFKLVADRIIDRADAAMLLRENRDQIDFDYLRGWLAKLSLSEGFSQIWQEAFPGESAAI
jgi:hypothetical protein